MKAALALLFSLSNAEDHQRAAVQAAEVYGLDHRMLLAQAYRESRYRPDVVSKVRAKDGGWFCGVLQVHSPTRKHCRRMRRSIHACYLKGAQEMSEWLTVCRNWKRRGKALYHCALSGYVSGAKAAKRGRNRSGYARNVMKMWDRLVRLDNELALSLVTRRIL